MLVGVLEEISVLLTAIGCCTVVLRCESVSFYGVTAEYGKARVIPCFCFMADDTGEIPEWREAVVVFLLEIHLSCR